MANKRIVLKKRKRYTLSFTRPDCERESHVFAYLSNARTAAKGLFGRGMNVMISNGNGILLPL